VEIIERGALDGLTPEEIKNFYPEANDWVLITRMRDGTEVKIAKKHIIERMKRCISDLEDGVDMIILLCTGEFPEIKSRNKKIILRPDRIMMNMIGGILEKEKGKGRLGVIAPSSDQITAVKKKWERTHLRVVVEAVSPYTGDREDVEKTARKISDSDVDLIVLDCLGFDKTTKSIFRSITHKPVLLPRTIVARVARELMEY